MCARETVIDTPIKLLTMKLFHTHAHAHILTLCVHALIHYNTHTRTHSMGAPVMVELEGETDPLKIAMKELKWAPTYYHTWATRLHSLYLSNYYFLP